MCLISPQFESLDGAGPTRSFICSLDELPEVRLTPYTVPNDSQAPELKTPAAVRSIPASPNSTSPSVSLDGATVSLAVESVLTLASGEPERRQLARRDPAGGEGSCRPTGVARCTGVPPEQPDGRGGAAGEVVDDQHVRV